MASKDKTQKERRRPQSVTASGGVTERKKNHQLAANYGDGETPRGDPLGKSTAEELNQKSMQKKIEGAKKVWRKHTWELGLGKNVTVEQENLGRIDEGHSRNKEMGRRNFFNCSPTNKRRKKMKKKKGKNHKHVVSKGANKKSKKLSRGETRGKG